MKKYQKKFVILLFIFIFKLNGNVHADIIPDGMEEILPIINQETIPERSRSYQGSAISEILWYVLLPISALAGIFFLLVFKKRKK
ncbi:MAG: hypothetical protein EA359_10445 [Balneolaceae bacterium]|nr:MAG: hypothetical protein EA359_10445 [Balneolaceae bacterium]